MRFLVDEMFGAEVADRLRTHGHEAVHVTELGLASADDRDVLARASENDQVVVTENGADFIPLLDSRIAAGLAAPPVLIVLKSRLPVSGGAMHHALAEKLHAWADDHPDPYRHVHWLS